MSKSFWRGFWEGANPVFWLACGLYWAGHLASLAMHYNNMAWLYPTYNRLMCWSSDIQDRFDFSGPWGKWKEKP